MARLLKKADQGPEIKQVQTLLMEKGYLTDEEINEVFDNETYRAVRLFQSQNLDQNGQPLTVDGKVVELTWWSLNHRNRSSRRQARLISCRCRQRVWAAASASALRWLWQSKS